MEEFAKLEVESAVNMALHSAYQVSCLYKFFARFMSSVNFISVTDLCVPSVAFSYYGSDPGQGL